MLVPGVVYLTHERSRAMTTGVPHHHADPSVAYSNPALGHQRTNYGLRAAMMSADVILEGNFDDGHGSGALSLERSAYLNTALIGDNVGLESLPREIEGVKERQVIQYVQCDLRKKS